MHQSDPAYPDAARGALNFTLEWGTVHGTPVIRWSGMYNGKGGTWLNKVSSANLSELPPTPVVASVAPDTVVLLFLLTADYLPRAAYYLLLTAYC